MTASEGARTRAGVLVIITDDTGRVQAAVADFEPSYAGGIPDRNRQESRARDAAWNQAIYAHASPTLADALTRGGTYSMDFSSTVRNLVSKGWQIEVREIDAPAEVEGQREAAETMLAALEHVRFKYLTEPVPAVDDAIARGHEFFGPTA